MPRAIQFIPILSVALAACHLSTDVHAPLEIALSVNQAVTTPTTPLEITVTVVNRGSNDVQTDDPRNYGCVPPYEISNAAGRRVGPPPRPCLAIAYAPLELARGESLVIHDRWSLDGVDDAGRAVPVGPGRYRLVARVISDNRTLASSPVAISVSATKTP